MPSVSVGAQKAAKMPGILGISRHILLQCADSADSMGFTVLRNTRDRRFFLLVEIAEVKETMEKLETSTPARYRDHIYDCRGIV